MRLFIMVAATAAATLFLHKSLTHSAAAESDQKPVDGQQTTTVQPQDPAAPTPLQTGKPNSTTATDVKSVNAFLTWTPTGVNEVQDVYNVRVATDPTVDLATGQLTTGIVKSSEAPLTTAQFDVTDLPEGTYYWQVESCSAAAPLICNGWSDVWALKVDNTAPVDPTIEYTGKPYSQTVSFAGTAEAAASVTISAGADDKTCVTTAAADGSWSCTFTDEFAYGDYTANVTAADKAGNQSAVIPLDFSVKELFVAPVIAMEALPPVLDIVPVDTTPENKTIEQPQIAKIDAVNMSPDTTPPVPPATDAPTIKPLSTDGGVIQSSENGWQIFGLPWFIWLGSGAGIASAMWAFGVPLPRRLTSFLSS